jgi:hypothetical protein
MWQQGDVNIVRCTDSQLLEKIPYRESAVIREGSTTGHRHRIVGTDFQLFETMDRIFARILSIDCLIVHEEHDAIALPVGDYEFLPTIEYDHFAEEARAVRD